VLAKALLDPDLVEVVVAQLDAFRRIAGKEDRNPFAEGSFERWIGVHIDHGDGRARAAASGSRRRASHRRGQ
jgi:hypothetical protein